ncbi:HU domain-containing protein [Pseudotenacibaculum haliotis]|uniref:SPOR domain-containing protein n=1 Tax=Pseudotenacibaculum haliotis TaxID=1862138 RepID=A0ABW5LR65_9FLAO
MALTTYIKDLLYRYDCVIVPDFGGFITNKISAQIDAQSHTFHPPSKQLGFNHHLTHNDGLLANYVASAENISFEKANQKIVEIVSKWNHQVKTETLVLDKVGSLHLNQDNQLVFEPNTEVNYLMSSFGLSSVTSSSIERPIEKVVSLVPATQERKGVPAFIKYAATAAIALTLGYGGWTGYQNKQDQLEFAKQKTEMDQKIQSATFVINNPLPTVELNVTKELPKPYHVVAGAFYFKENAQKRVNQLKSKGYNAYILGKNKSDLIQVAYESFYKVSDAYQSLAEIRKADSKDAWLLIKKFD